MGQQRESLIELLFIFEKSYFIFDILCLFFLPVTPAFSVSGSKYWAAARCLMVHIQHNDILVGGDTQATEIEVEHS